MKLQLWTRAWELLKDRLIAGAEEYSAANATGVLDRIPGLMRWGIAVRDAWSQVFRIRNHRRMPVLPMTAIPTLDCR